MEPAAKDNAPVDPVTSPQDRDDVLEKLKRLSTISEAARAALLQKDTVVTNNFDEDALRVEEEEEPLSTPKPSTPKTPKQSLFGAWGDNIKSKANDGKDSEGNSTHTAGSSTHTAGSSTPTSQKGAGVEDDNLTDLTHDDAAVADKKADESARRAVWEQAVKNCKFWEVRPAKQYYYKFPDGMSAAEQAQHQKG